MPAGSCEAGWAEQQVPQVPPQVLVQVLEVAVFADLMQSGSCLNYLAPPAKISLETLLEADSRIEYGRVTGGFWAHLYVGQKVTISDGGGGGFGIFNRLKVTSLMDNPLSGERISFRSSL